MKTIKKFWKTPLLSFGLLILCTSSIFLIRSFYNFHINIVIALIAFMLLTYGLLRRAVDSKERITHTFLLLTPFVVLSILAFFQPIIIYAPGLIFAPVIGVLLGYLLTISTHTLARLTIAAMPLLIGFWVYVRFSDIWQDFMIYGTFSNGETIRECPDFTFFKDSVALDNDDFAGKTTVFFIWNTQCVYTPRYLPALKEKFVRFGDEEDIDFYMVNIPLPSDTVGSDLAYLARHDIAIENLTGPTIDELYKKFGPGGFPTTMVLDPKGDIVFWGSVAKIDRTLSRATGTISKHSRRRHQTM